MTAPNTPPAGETPTTALATTDGQPSTAVAATPPAETAEQQQSRSALAIGNLPEEIRQGLILKRQQNMVTAAIAGTNWGQGIDKDVRFRIAEWAQSAGLDPATELDVLGGRFYKNAQYYLRKLSEMISAGIVEYALADHVEADPRLEKIAARTDNPTLAATARAESDRRQMIRIEYAIPEAAVSSVVFRVKLRAIAHEFTAAKWCGGGTRKKDPVGDDFPVETSESRAARRCMRLIASQNPHFAPLVEPNDDDTIDATIGGQLREGLQRAKAQARMVDRPVQPVTSGYSDEPKAALTAPVMTGTPPEDPYTGGKVADVRPAPAPTPTPAPAAAPAAPAKRAAADDFDDAVNELDLLSPAERAEHDQRKRDGRA